MIGLLLIADHVRPEVEEAASSVGAFAASRVQDLDAQGLFPAEELSLLRENGLLGLFASTDRCSDTPGNLAEYVRVAQVLGRASLSLAIIWSMHSQQVWTTVRCAPSIFPSELIDGIRLGRIYLGSVTTESATGGDPTKGAEPLRLDTSGVILIDRNAPIVTGGEFADGFVVKVSGLDSRSRSDTVFAFIHRDDTEVEIVERIPTLGMRSTGNVGLRIRGEIRPWGLLEGSASQIVRDHFGPLAHIGWAASWLGSTESAWQRTLNSVRSRRREILSSETALELIGRIQEHIEVVRALLASATAASLDCTPLDSAELPVSRLPSVVSSLKTASARECIRATELMLELSGFTHGYRLDSETQLERHIRDIKSARLLFSDTKLRKASAAQVLMHRNVLD